MLHVTQMVKLLPLGYHAHLNKMFNVCAIFHMREELEPLCVSICHVNSLQKNSLKFAKLAGRGNLVILVNFDIFLII